MNLLYASKDSVWWSMYPRPGVRADDQGGHPEPVAVLVDRGRDHVVVEAAPVVPGQEDRGGIPVGAFHDGIDQVGDVGLAGGEVRRRVVAVGLGGGDPGDRGQGAVLGRGVERRQVLDVAELAVLLDVGEAWEGFQIDGVLAPWATGAQPAAVSSGLSSQSGWMPLCT